LAEARQGKRTVYFADASHFVLASFLGWVWCFVRLRVRGGVGPAAIQRARGAHLQDFKKFQAAIDGCLSDLTTKHREKLATLMTHQFQTWDDVSLLDA